MKNLKTKPRAISKVYDLEKDGGNSQSEKMTKIIFAFMAMVLILSILTKFSLPVNASEQYQQDDQEEFQGDPALELREAFVNLMIEVEQDGNVSYQPKSNQYNLYSILNIITPSGSCSENECEDSIFCAGMFYLRKEKNRCPVMKKCDSQLFPNLITKENKPIITNQKLATQQCWKKCLKQDSCKNSPVAKKYIKNNREKLNCAHKKACARTNYGSCDEMKAATIRFDQSVKANTDITTTTENNPSAGDHAKAQKIHDDFIGCLEAKDGSKETKLYSTCQNECNQQFTEAAINIKPNCQTGSSNEMVLSETHDKCISKKFQSIKPFVAKIINGDEPDVSNSGFAFMEHCLAILKIDNGKKITAKEIANSDNFEYKKWFDLKANFLSLFPATTDKSKIQMTPEADPTKALASCVDQSTGSNYIENYSKAISYCGAMFSYVSHKDTTSGDQLEKATKSGDISSMTPVSNSNLLNVQGGDPAQQQMAMAMQQATKQTHIDCKFKGVITRDYSQCSLFAQTYDGFSIGKQITSGVQGTKLALDDQNCGQTITKEEVAAGTGALKCMKNSKKAQANVAGTRADLSGAQLATLSVMYSKMPDTESIKTNCIDNYKNFIDSSDGFLDADNACDFLAQDDNTKLLMNESEKMKMKMILLQAGVETAQNIIARNLLNKQANQINDVANKINAFTPQDYNGKVDAFIQKCQADPSLPGCAKVQAYNPGWGQNGLGPNFGSSTTATGTAYGTSPTGTTGNNNTSTSSGINPGAGTNFAGVTTPNSAGGGINAPGPGSLGKGSLGGGNGGGSGGGAGATAPAKGKGGGSGGARSRGHYKGKNYTYGSGGSSGASYASSKSRRSRRSKNGNPFKSMFGKKGKKSSRVYKYRTPASAVGGKSDQIFEMISRRYNVVKGKERLLDYTVVDQ